MAYRDDNGTCEKQYGLHALGPYNREQTAEHGVDPRQYSQDSDKRDQRIRPEYFGVGSQAKDSAQHPRCGVKRYTHVNDNGGKQRDDRQDIAAATIKAALEEIWQRCDARAQIKGRKKKAKAKSA
jgi:hypothetical protein